MEKQIILTQNNFGIPIELQFVSDTNSPIDLTDKIVEVAISYDGTIIDVIQATISSYTDGTAYIVTTTRHTSNVGLYTTFWSVKDRYGYITAQSDLYYYVKGEYNGAENNGIEQDKGTIEEEFDKINSQLDKIETNNNENFDRINLKFINRYSANVKDFGAVGDGITDDTQALIQAFAYDNIEIPSGIYRVTDTISFENKNVFGTNMTHVTILGDIEDPMKPILAVGGQSVIRDITVAFADSRITGGERMKERIGIQLFGGFRNLPFQTGAGIYNCQVNNCGTGISDGGASVFSANFKDIRISKFTCRGFEMTGAARTGNVYDNIYITNHPYTRNDGTGDKQIAWQGFVLSGEESECTITQLNVEHATLFQAIIIEDVLGLTAGSIHIEGVELRDNWTEYVKIVRTQGKIDNISFYYTRHKTGTSLIKFGDTKKADTTNDFYSDNVNFEIGTLVCKGLNRPDRNTYGYEPNYPVSASTLSGSIQPFYFINRESASDKYYVTLNRYNWITYNYGFDDKQKYIDFSCNSHGSITFLKKAHMEI